MSFSTESGAGNCEVVGEGAMATVRWATRARAVSEEGTVILMHVIRGKWEEGSDVLVGKHMIRKILLANDGGHGTESDCVEDYGLAVLRDGVILVLWNGHVQM